MDETRLPATKLHPAIARIWMLHTLIGTLIVGGLLVTFDIFALADTKWPLPSGVGGGILTAVYFVVSFSLVRARYRAWSYELREHDLLLTFGVIWKVRRSVPRLRIQHADITSGPLSRAFGVVTLTVFTAGSGGADAEIPGLTPEQAEKLHSMIVPQAKS